MRFRSLLALAVSLCCLGGAQAQDAVKMRYLPTKEPVVYRKTHQFKQTQKIMDKTIANEIETNEVDLVTITETDKKDLNFKTEAKKLKTKMKLAGMEYEFDSAKDDNDKGSTLGGALTPLYERLAGATINFTVTPQGKVTGIQGYKELIGDVIKDNPLAAQFAGGGSEESAKVGLSEYFPLFEEKAVSPGHRWETPFQFNADKFGKATGKRFYTYEGEGKVGQTKTAKINVTTELNFELDIDMGGAKVTGKLSITDSKGTIHFDPALGRLISMNGQYTVSGNLNVSVNGMDIPIALEQVQTIGLEQLAKLPK